MDNVTYLDVSATNHDTVHLLQSELCGLGDLVLNEGKALVFISDRVPWKVDTLNWTEGNKGLLYCVLLNLKVYTSNIYPAAKNLKNPEYSKLKFFEMISNS